MKLVLALGLLLMAGNAAPSSDIAGWKTLVSKEGRFSVKMPAPVEETYAPSPEKGGTVRQYFYKTSSTAGEDYVASCWDYTGAPERQLDVTDLDQCVTAQRDSLEPKSSSIKTILLGNIPGRELRVTPVHGQRSVFRLYLSGRRLYSISVTERPNGSGLNDAEAFLDSFRLLP